VKVLLTGAGGFLGQHTRARLRALSDHEVVPVDRAAWSCLSELASGVGAVIHLAGVNRADPAEVERGNVELAREVAAAVQASGSRPVIVFANSIQAGNGTPYGMGKAEAASVLAAAARAVGSVFVDVRLPNLFGEHGRPDYNSFVASFTRSVVEGRTPPVSDRPVELLHVQAASQVLLEALERATSAEITPRGTATSVQAVLDKLRCFNQLYATGDLPPLLADLDVDLFNTLRAARFPHHYPIPLTPRSDERGRLTEVVRSHGGQGQTFVSTTRPGITRGEHFHLRKVERFVVLGGEARISLRRLFTEEIVSFEVDGGSPVIVDMPTLWAHNITNTGSSELTTLFWTHELFDPAAPDTFAEPVGS
jgi:UDP-2-acetamido-2,6-beta-L-arabino-hexul-4-ose reductase